MTSSNQNVSLISSVSMHAICLTNLILHTIGEEFKLVSVQHVTTSLRIPY